MRPFFIYLTVAIMGSPSMYTPQLSFDTRPYELVDSSDCRSLVRPKLETNITRARNTDRPLRPSDSRGAPDVPEPFALGAQYLTRYNTWKKSVRDTRPAIVYAIIPKTSVRVKNSSYSEW